MDPLARINAAFGVYRSGPMLDGDGNAGSGGGGGGQAGGTSGGAGGGTAGATGGTAGSTQGAGGQSAGDGAGTGQAGTSATGGTGSGNGTQTVTLSQDELNANYAGVRRETEREVRKQVQREAAEAAETERTEAERKAAEERGDFDTVKNGLISERDTLKAQVTERDNELKDLRTLAQQQFDDLTKDLPDALKAMIPGDSTPLTKRIESARSARTYHDEQKGGTGSTGGRGNQGTGGTSRGTGNDPKPNGDGEGHSGIKVGIGLFGRTNS